MAQAYSKRDYTGAGDDLAMRFVTGNRIPNTRL